MVERVFWKGIIAPGGGGWPGWLHYTSCTGRLHPEYVHLVFSTRKCINEDKKVRETEQKFAGRNYNPKLIWTILQCHWCGLIFSRLGIPLRYTKIFFYYWRRISFGWKFIRCARFSKWASGWNLRVYDSNEYPLSFQGNELLHKCRILM